MGKTVTLHAPVLLAEPHRLDDFDCGTVSLDDWLKRRARTNQTSGASRTYVVAENDNVVGYYALASSSIAHSDVTSRMSRNMPQPIPVIALVRLAVDRRLQGKGLGRDLVQDAAKRVIAAADLIGVRGMIVHAISEEAKAFYLARGFFASPTNDLTLMISVSDLKANL